MIASFRCRDTEELWVGGNPRRFAHIRRAALVRLNHLNNAERIEQLYIPPSNRLEALKGDRAGQLSIRINNRYRICFTFSTGNAHDVEIVDYH